MLWNEARRKLFPETVTWNENEKTAVPEDWIEERRRGRKIRVIETKRESKGKKWHSKKQVPNDSDK